MFSATDCIRLVQLFSALETLQSKISFTFGERRFGILSFFNLMEQVMATYCGIDLEGWQLSYRYSIGL